MSIQTKILFPAKKSSSFYGSKTPQTPKLDFANATCRSTPTVYTPTAKKIMELSDDSEPDSDAENSQDEKNTSIDATPKRKNRKGKKDAGVSPPKQRKLQTPTKTPSTLVRKLKLDTSPESSKKGGRKVTCKKLFEENSYQTARLALHSDAPVELPGREKELSELRDFVKQHIDNKTSGSLYVSGPPGTGKTASLFKTMKEFKASSYKAVYVNCTSMKSPNAIYTKILEELNLKSTPRNKKSVIEKHLLACRKTVLLVLDEIDQLETKSQSVLYSIFEWPAIVGVKLILIGIANALDLTDRILPRLQARIEIKPKLLHFAGYSKQQIADIISNRLQQANSESIFTPRAIQLLAGKVAAVSGDVRRALDISRRVVELAETNKITQILQPNINEINGASPKKNDLSTCAVDFKEVLSVLNEIYGGAQNIDKEESSFPLQEKILLCSLMLILNKGRNKDVTLGKLFAVYKKVCNKRKVNPMDTPELASACTLIETRGIVKITRKKDTKMSKICLQWDQDTLAAALQDQTMMSEIINDASCL